MKKIYFILLSIFLLSGSWQAVAQEEHSEKTHSKKFEPGSFIMNHVADAYEWHITGSHEHPVSLPLPIILYSETSGLHFFMSSVFHHEKEHNGFSIGGKDSKYKGKIVENINGEFVRPYDISITKNTLSLFIGLTLLLWIFLSVAKTYRRREGKAPKGLQSFIEPLIIFIRDDVAKASIGEKKYEKYTPYLLTIFFFIFLNNLMGLIPIIPGGANLTGNIAITMVLAILTFIITTVNGNKNYWSHIILPPVPHALKPILIPIEIMGMFIKPFVLMVRLFANMTAGHIVALGFFSLIFIFGEKSTGAGYGISVMSITFTVFMTMLELLVAFIQAYVFTLLSALYFGMATEEHAEG